MPDFATTETNTRLTDRITGSYRELFNQEPDVIVFAPGRINLIGEHTDYNDGFVLPGAVDLGIYFAIGRANGNSSHWYALDKNEHFSGEFDQHRARSGTWADYMYGAWDIMKRDLNGIPAFNCVFGADLPAGSGMSSSSALTCGVLLGISELAGLSIDPKSLALMAYSVERNYVGVSGGIMDQFACLLSSPNSLLLLDCRDQSYRNITLEGFEKELFLIHSHVHRELTTSDYNVRAEECSLATRQIHDHFININSLRDVVTTPSREEFGFLNDTLFQRVKYVSEENARVLEAVKYIGNHNWKMLGEVLYQGHHGLSQLYEVSIPEIDFLVEMTKSYDWILGARLMGGGFGGCTINLADTQPDAEFMDTVNQEYQHRFNTKAELISVKLGDSARRLN